MTDSDTKASAETSEILDSGTKAGSVMDETLGLEKIKMSSFVAEIDTLLPFELVKEHNLEEVDIAKVEEQAALLEKDLIVKELETLDVLKDWETTKMIVEKLKLKLQKEAYESIASLELNSDDNTRINPFVKETEKQNPENLLVTLEVLSRTTNDLAGIRAFVESLNKKIEKERTSLKNIRLRLISNSTKISSLEEELNLTRLKLQLAKDAEMKASFENPIDILRELQQLSSEAVQFKKMAETSKSEILRAMLDIEQTKTSIKTAEMRWIAAKKMAEAARAAETVALAEIDSLSFEEYSYLIHETREAEEFDTILEIDEVNISQIEILKRAEKAEEEVKTSKKALEEALNRVDAAQRGKLVVDEALRKWRFEHSPKRREVYNSTKFKNSYTFQHRRDPRMVDVNRLNLVSNGSKSVLRPTLSIGQILSKKLMPEEFEKPKVSLGQMLGKQSGLSSPPQMSKTEGIGHKKLSAKRKKFGLVRLSLLLTKQSKKKKKPQTPK